MSFIMNIRSVAKYESKILVRSWFFRIFTLLAVVFFRIFQLCHDVDGGQFRPVVCKIGFIQYTLSEPFVVEYGTGGGRSFPFFRISERDKKLDTSEVFYVRPLSNAEYVVGKIWGNLRVFLFLNLLVLAIVLAFNFMASGVTVDLRLIWFISF